MTMMDEDADREPAIRSVGGLDVFDSNGDLYFQVGKDVEEKTKTYFVCSKALARASAVFDKMLYGGFAESRPADACDSWTVELPEDRQEPMELLLHIVHGRFEMVPDQLELTRLYQFLVVVEKYDATGVTRPWARGWMEAVKTSMQNPLLLGDATSIRKTLLTTMLEPYSNLYTTLKHGDRCMSSPQDPTGGKRCDSILLGSLIRSFAAQRIDLTAPDPVAAYRGSASALQSVLLKLELYTVHSGYSHPSSTPFSFGQAAHPRFGFSLSACEHVLQSGLREGVERSLMLRGDMSFVQPKHREYLQKQAAKTGLAK
ncbi:uncharacterized protein ColSpa_12122 [Colletotrichum spaethianum]|uniref:BTB domain-containing protein n=1 Tax=Colletotrichum spaethianum TaxID=700344 RepID=A0AA37PGM7_9PEZI|nr:uncharacterized protein ColSpa_12122 [Colletotrichum spaethianum]GKT51941.1 hypothetical protein ColSpa_12122 [Colletotrichum spaethianum]